MYMNDEKSFLFSFFFCLFCKVLIFFHCLFCIGKQLIDNVVMALGTQWNDSAIRTHDCPLSSSPIQAVWRWAESPSCAVYPCGLSTLNVAVCAHQCWGSLAVRCLDSSLLVTNHGFVLLWVKTASIYYGPTTTNCASSEKAKSLKNQKQNQKIR